MIGVLGWLFDATLKGSVVIFLIALTQRLIARRVDARWRHALWLVVLLRLALPIAPSSSWSIFNLFPEQPAVPMRIGVTVDAPTPLMLPAAIPATIQGLPAPWWVDIWKWIAALWLAGVVALLLRALIATIGIDLEVHVERRPTTAAVGRAALLRATQGVVDDARSLLGITRQVRVVETNIVRTPALHGLIRPTLLLPPGLIESFDRDEIRHVVLHELWHLRRLDVAVSWLLTIVSALHWFNPFVWFAVSRIREERELACDELALSCLEEDERFGYGRTILRLLERFREATPVPALVGIVNHKEKMKRRLMMIAAFRNRSRFSILFLAALGVVGAIGLTDARGGDRRFLRKLDPAAAQTMERLDQRVTFDLTNASLADLLNAVSNKTGVTVTQSPDIATSKVQQARFTLHAENVPAHAVLMEALMPFELAPDPDANGVTIASGPSCAMMIHEGVVKAEIPGHGESEKRIVIRTTGPSECKLDANGNLHRELTLNIEQDGSKSEGKLILDISGLKAK